METAAFYIFSAFAVTSLLAMLRSRTIVRAIIWFAAFLIIMAAFFGLLKASLLAMGQLVIFTGGLIAVLLIGISFSGMDSAAEISRSNANYSYKALALFFLLTLMVSVKLFFAYDAAEVPAAHLAAQLFGAYWPVISIIMLMFIAALLSAVYFLKRDE